MNEYSAKLLPKMAKNANDFAFKSSISYTMLCSIIVTYFIYSVKSTTNLMKASIFVWGDVVEERFPPFDLTHFILSTSTTVIIFYTILAAYFPSS